MSEFYWFDDFTHEETSNVWTKMHATNWEQAELELHDIMIKEESMKHCEPIEVYEVVETRNVYYPNKEDIIKHQERKERAELKRLKEKYEKS